MSYKADDRYFLLLIFKIIWTDIILIELYLIKPNTKIIPSFDHFKRVYHSTEKVMTGRINAQKIEFKTF